MGTGNFLLAQKIEKFPRTMRTGFHTSSLTGKFHLIWFLCIVATTVFVLTLGTWLLVLRAVILGSST